MYFLYSMILSIGFLLMLPLFILRREKYASGFSQRLGNYAEFNHDDRKVIWLHCVSVGETNAARPLVDAIKEKFPDHRLVFSTTTKTGQELAQKIFAEKADAVFYFPFDWRFSVRKALENYKPSVVLLMETEIWPRFIREAKRSGAKVAIVNGRLSEKSSKRYSLVGPLIKNVLVNIDLALMQSEKDATRIVSLGIDIGRTKTTGNLKFDLELDPGELDQADRLDKRFKLSGGTPLIIAASTHADEEWTVLSAFRNILNWTSHTPIKNKPRLLIAPRHPERFDSVANLVTEFPTLSFARRTADESQNDPIADVILLDSIGELRSLYRFAEIVFVGGSIVPHGGQSVLEPAMEGKAIVTGCYTFNFDAVIKEFLAKEAIYQLPEIWWQDFEHSLLPVEQLQEVFAELLFKEEMRRRLGSNAYELMQANRGATANTIEALHIILSR